LLAIPPPRPPVFEPPNGAFCLLHSAEAAWEAIRAAGATMVATAVATATTTFSTAAHHEEHLVADVHRCRCRRRPDTAGCLSAPSSNDNIQIYIYVYFKNVHIFACPFQLLAKRLGGELPGRVYSISYCVTLSCAKNNCLSFKTEHVNCSVWDKSESNTNRS
jgi:hypothetical protein